MLSELATSLYALTATRDNGLWNPRRRQFLPKALPRCLSSALSALIVGVSGYCLSPRGKRVGLVPDQSSQRAGVLRGDRPKIPLAIGFRPACETSLESLGRTSACRFAEAGQDPRKGVSGQS